MTAFLHLRLLPETPSSPAPCDGPNLSVNAPTLTGRLPLGNTAKHSKARLLTCLVVLAGISGCSPKQDDSSAELVRGLRAYKVAAKAEGRVRRFASLLQPAEVSRLSFEIPGQLRTVSLEARPTRPDRRFARRNRSTVAPSATRTGQCRRATGGSTARECRGGFCAQGRVVEKGLRDASSVGPISSNRAHHTRAAGAN